MSFKVPFIVLSVSFFIIVRKYWRAKDDRDGCLMNLDKHVKYVKEIQAEASQNKLIFEKNIKQQEMQIEIDRKEKMNAESKLRFCENQNKNQLTDLRLNFL